MYKINVTQEIIHSTKIYEQNKPKVNYTMTFKMYYFSANSKRIETFSFLSNKQVFERLRNLLIIIAEIYNMIQITVMH